MSNCRNKPSLCCHPNCFACPYEDCKYERLEAIDYDISRKIDLDNSENHKLHRDDAAIKGKHNAKKRGTRKYVDRHEYNKLYYEAHKEQIKASRKARYQRQEKSELSRKEYQAQLYQVQKEERKRKARERYYEKKRLEQSLSELQ